MSRRAFTAAAAAGAVTIITGCSSKSNNSTAAKSTDKVTYLTGFGTSPREGYMQVGIAKGFFKDAGIEVTVQPGQPSDANLKTLAAGKAQFAAIDYVSAIRGAATYVDSPGVPNFRIAAAIHSRTLLSLVTLDSTGITRPADLVGKTLAAAPNAAGQTLFPTYAKLAGIDPGSVKYVNLASDALPTALAAGSVQAINSYSVDVPSVASAAKGHKAIALPYSDYIQDLFGTVLLTQASIAKSNPDLVKRFSAASVKSAQYAVAHPDEAAQIIKSKQPTTNLAATSQVMTLMAPYVGTGALEQSRVMRGISLLEGANLAKSGLTPDKLLVAAAIMPAA
jgi:NitT/TauT family transport system substrate-binding protein